MAGFIQQLKENKIIINTNSKGFEINHFKALLFMFVLSGLSSLLGYVLLGIFGNNFMLFGAFIAPVILFYIYTLCEDVVNPLFTKLGFTQIDLINQADTIVEKAPDDFASSNLGSEATNNK